MFLSELQHVCRLYQCVFQEASGNKYIEEVRLVVGKSSLLIFKLLFYYIYIIIVLLIVEIQKQIKTILYISSWCSSVVTNFWKYPDVLHRFEQNQQAIWLKTQFHML